MEALIKHRMTYVCMFRPVTWREASATVIYNSGPATKRHTHTHTHPPAKDVPTSPRQTRLPADCQIFRSESAERPLRRHHLGFHHFQHLLRVLRGPERGRLDEADEADGVVHREVALVRLRAAKPLRWDIHMYVCVYVYTCI